MASDESDPSGDLPILPRCSIGSSTNASVDGFGAEDRSEARGSCTPSTRSCACTSRRRRSCWPASPSTVRSSHRGRQPADRSVGSRIQWSFVLRRSVVMLHKEVHRTHRIGWLRAAVLGANDGIVSTASLIIGVAASNASRSEVLVAGMAGLVAGAMSMAAGEYVSVSSQADTEAADLERERTELRDDPERELEELTSVSRSAGAACRSRTGR